MHVTQHTGARSDNGVRSDTITPRNSQHWKCSDDDLLNVITPRIIRFLGAAVVAPWALLNAPIPAASAASCPDTQVVFARGTGEPPGVGGIGQEVIDKLRSRRPGCSDGLQFAEHNPAAYEDGLVDHGADSAAGHL